MYLVKILVVHHVVFLYFLISFVIMNFIEYIMYELCANYEIGILDYVFHI